MVGMIWRQRGNVAVKSADDMPELVMTDEESIIEKAKILKL